MTPRSSNQEVANRDGARDLAVASRAQVWKTYVDLLGAIDSKGMSAALFFTRGGRQSMVELGEIMQSDRSLAELPAALEAWQQKNQSTLDAFAFSGEASAAWTRLVSIDAPFAAKMAAEFERADLAFAKAFSL